MKHAVACPANVPLEQRLTGRLPSACTCGIGAVECDRTRPLFPGLDIVPAPESAPAPPKEQP